MLISNCTKTPQLVDAQGSSAIKVTKNEHVQLLMSELITLQI
jgi:hypothetical protein